MYNILLVEDSDTIIMGLKYSLEQEKFVVTVAKDVKTAMENINENKFDFVILDITLPDGNGFDVCRYIKSKYDIPVIFLTARDEETNVVLGLDIGADDYIVKPFRVKELISRINNVLRRYQKMDKNKSVITYQDIVIDTNFAKVTKNNEEIFFSALEYKILLMLFSNQNILVKREQILDKIWDISGNFVNDNTLSVYIKRIREKIGDSTCDPKIIKTIRGIGYIVGDKT